jgi:hypothetical protein
MILDALRAVDQRLATYPEPLAADRRVPASLAVVPQVLNQDITMIPAGTPPLRPRVAEDRRIRVEGAEMRHGRQSRSRLMDGDKRHVRRNRDRHSNGIGSARNCGIQVV